MLPLIYRLCYLTTNNIFTPQLKKTVKRAVKHRLNPSFEMPVPSQHHCGSSQDDPLLVTGFRLNFRHENAKCQEVKISQRDYRKKVDILRLQLSFILKPIMYLGKHNIKGN